VADVQGWVNNPSTNDGWELINADEHDATTFDAFFSREATSAAGVTNPATQLPSLVVNFTSVPEPASAALVGAALLLGGFARPSRRRR
jgi:hypothetical protein